MSALLRRTGVPALGAGAIVISVGLALFLGRAAHSPQRSAAAVPGCAPVSVLTENTRPGSTGWRPDPHVTAPIVQGFADRTSAMCGQRLTLRLGARIRGPVPVRIQAWRLGFYHGRGGRLVWSSRILVVRHPAKWATVTPQTHMVSAPWPVTTVLTIPHDWPQGVYVLRIMPLRNRQAGGEIPLVVRDPNRRTRYVHVLAANTWEMYNAWGGSSAYSKTRSLVVSFDRPYQGSEPKRLLTDDFPLVWFTERLGLDISYATDVDLGGGGPEFDAAKALLFGNHSEYWTTDMRTHLEQAIGIGANAVFFGADNMYWRPVPVGAIDPYRQLAIYRFPHVDPYGRMAARASVMWRQPPISRPEQALLGEQYGCVGVLMPMVAPDPSLGWMFADSGARPGQLLPGVNYYETDVPDFSYPIPPQTQLVTRQSFGCPRRGESRSGAAVTVVPVHGPSGAIVIDMGTQGWVCMLNASCTTAPALRWGRWVGPSDPITQGGRRNLRPVRAIVERVTRTILNVVGAGPGGRLATTRPYPLVDQRHAGITYRTFRPRRGSSLLQP
jgi:hypothetical protein